MGEMKIGANGVGKIFLGNMQIFGGFTLEVKDNSFRNTTFIGTVTFVNNSSKIVTVRIEGLDASFSVIDSIDVDIPANSVLIRPSYPDEIYANGRPNIKLTIITNITYTSYSFYCVKASGITGATRLNVENIVDSSLNVFEYKSAPRYGGAFCGTFLFND